jgi:hypothetical protein
MSVQKSSQLYSVEFGTGTFYRLYVLNRRDASGVGAFHVAGLAGSAFSHRDPLSGHLASAVVAAIC